MKYILATAVMLAVCSASEAKCGLFKGRLRHAVHRTVDAPFKAAAGLKAGVKAAAAPCPDGKCPVPAAPVKK